MLKLFVAAAELALPLCLLSAVLIANRSYPPAHRQRVGRLTVVSLATGAVAAAAVAGLRLNTKHIRLPAINLWAGVFLLLALVAFGVALWWMGRRSLVAEDSGGLPGRVLTGTSLVTLLLAHFFHGIPLYLASDRVVPMGGTLFASDSLINLIGYLLGIAVTASAGLVLAISLLRVPGLARLILTTGVVGIALGTQWPQLYQQFSTAKLLPKSSLNFQALLWVQRNTVTILLVYVALVVAAAVIAYLTRPRSAPAEAAAAEHRLVKAEGISRRRMLGWSAALGLGLVTTYTVGKQVAEAVPELSPIEPSTVNGPHVEVDLQLVSDGHLHRFAYESSGGTQVRFIAIQKNPTSFGTGLDACEICGPSGYYEREGKVVCRECDVIMNTQTIGFPGGCNPIPIQYELTADKLLFQVAELEQQARVFA
ncbi:MAG: Fe-S-containing protein [Propionicimonas sp.]